MSKGLLVFNPKAGKQDENLLPSLCAALGEVETAAIDEVGENVAERARSSGCAWVAVAGGDGTVEGVAAGLVGGDLPLGIIPAGTYNNFARSLDLPADPVEACAVIKAGRVGRIDAGCANGRYFFECLGSGLDASLYPLGEEIKCGRLSRLGRFFRKAYRYGRQSFVLTLDRPVCRALVSSSSNESHRLVHHLAHRQGREITLSALMLTVSNGAYFGMNFTVAPDQRMDDGFLTVTVFSRYSKLQLWRHFFSIAFGRREYCPKTVAFRVERLEIASPRQPAVHLDGTPQKDLWPLKIECRPAALAVFRP